MAFSIRILSILCIFSLYLPRLIADSSVCARLGVNSFANGIRSQCPVSIEQFPPEEASGDELDRNLGHTQGNVYYSIFFYATWCPFSKKAKPIFYALSSMFPQIRHLAVKESSALPSVFSRYGIHGFPSILIANRTARMQYQGPRDLNSLVNFYKETTGFDPVSYFSVEESPNLETVMPPHPWNQHIGEIVKAEPYLVFSLFFICLKALAYVFPMIVSHVKAFLFTHALHINLGMFGVWNNLLERVLHVINLEKLWSKLRLCNKARNFHKGAKNARVWASSLTSVSLGESSSSRDL